jgi:hypothetical protein
VSTRPLLEAHIDSPEDQLRRRLDTLERSVEDLRAELRETVNAQRAFHASAYNAFIQVFGGEVADSSDTPTRPHSHVSAAWEGWKRRLGPTEGEIIDVLIHGQYMTCEQLRIAIHKAYSSTSGALKKMSDLGLLDRNGPKYGLKKL